MNSISSFFLSSWYIWMIGVLAVMLSILRPKIRGFFGEKTVALILSLLDKNKYKALNNVMLSINGKTSQIDHIVVSIHGIFVIETKNYRGWILGDEHSDYWIQVIYKHKEKFYNPIKQNYGHVQALKSFLSEYDLPYHSIVVFSTKATLKVKTSQHVIYTINLLRTIKKLSKNAILSDRLCNQIVTKLASGNIEDKEERRLHVRNIHRNLEETRDKKNSGICPKCGGVLVIRKGKNGTFTGCTNYPTCRFTT